MCCSIENDYQRCIDSDFCSFDSWAVCIATCCCSCFIANGSQEKCSCQLCFSSGCDVVQDLLTPAGLRHWEAIGKKKHCLIDGNIVWMTTLHGMERNILKTCRSNQRYFEQEIVLTALQKRTIPEYQETLWYPCILCKDKWQLCSGWYWLLPEYGLRCRGRDQEREGGGECREGGINWWLWPAWQ